jgi:hypothetical protein
MDADEGAADAAYASSRTLGRLRPRGPAQSIISSSLCKFDSDSHGRELLDSGVYGTVEYPCMVALSAPAHSLITCLMLSLP